MTKTYDVKCAELAEHFLQGHPHRQPGDTERLAGVVQNAIEDWMCDYVDSRAGSA